MDAVLRYCIVTVMCVIAVIQASDHDRRFIVSSGSVSCDFSTDSVCGWNKQNWLRRSGHTPSAHTGPDTGHGTDGFYMYAEASSPRRAGDRLHMTSPSFNTGNQQMRVQFWYSVYGSGIGSLNAYIMDMGTTTMGNPIWSISQGTTAAEWKQGCINIPPQDKERVLVFESVIGKNFLSDIAIDDVILDKGTCTTGTSIISTTTTTTAPATGGTAGSCTFEAGNLCGYTQERTDNFDWTRHRGRTSSALTGPDGDHTTGTGYYMYIEVSSPRQPGEKARIASPLISTGNSQMSLEFWYNMYGGQIGQLNVYIHPDNTVLGQPIFHTTQHSGTPTWQHACINLAPHFNNVHIVFEGVRGAGIQGDLAIDDISVTSGACHVTSAPLTTMPTAPVTTHSSSGPSVTCNFEAADMCGYTNLNTDNFNWLRLQGNTASSGTGPNGDHTTKQGYYIYIETSSPRKPGDIAKIASPIFSSGPHSSLRFWYDMNGASVGVLNVYFESGTFTSSTPSIEHQVSFIGQSGADWKQECIDIPANLNGVHVVFEGVVGNAFSGDIAIDDVTMSSQSCHSTSGRSAPVDSLNSESNKRFLLDEGDTELTCDFEDDICEFNPAQGKLDWHRSNYGHTYPAYMPTSDHTFLTSGHHGHYMFMRSTSNARAGASAILRTPVVVGNNQMMSLRFSYFMNGPHPGDLMIKTREKGTNHHYWSTKLTESDNHSTTWHDACVELQIHTTQIEFVATQDFSKIGNCIAIDDVTLKPGACDITTPQPTPMATHAPSSISCNFDNGGICGYVQSHVDDFDWTRKHGSTSTSSTGPEGDHTSGKGYYMYIETSNPRNQGDTAVLRSPLVTSPSQHLAVDFWYNMHGTNIGSLQVYMDPPGDVHTLFTATKGSDTAVWQHACVNVPAFTIPSQLVFEAVVGHGIHGDIAIEDVSVTSGYCSSTSGSGSHLTTHAPPAVNGAWGTWSSYSSCTATCGSAYKARHRYCNNPAPSHGGHTCSGASSQSVTCYLTTCHAAVVNGGLSVWTTWSKCTTSCDLGQITRHRSCTNPVPTLGGANCTGSTSESHDCTLGPCPEWSHWFPGPCSTSCGNGTLERLRQCNTGTNSDCGGPAYQIIPCMEPVCADKENHKRFLLDEGDTELSFDFEGDWEEFTSIDGPLRWHRSNRGHNYAAYHPISDHTNVTSNHRGHYMYMESTPNAREGATATIRTPVVTGNNQMMSLRFSYYMNGPHPGDLMVKTRERPGQHAWSTKLTESDNHGTTWQDACVELQIHRTQIEFVAMQDFSKFGNCIAIDDVTLKSGTCAKTTPQPTPMVTNALNGAWGTWSSYSSCTATCGSAYKARHRYCNNPAPSHGGHTCSGASTQSVTCHLSTCHTAAVNGNWGSWSTYSACAVTCGDGLQTSHRSCNNPAPSHGGHTCTGSGHRQVKCHKAGCIVNGGLSVWTTWSKCTASCDLGQITRHRSCTNPVPTLGGANCTGSTTETHDCTLGPCPEWSHWFNGPCSTSCGNGTLERLRQCNTGTNSDCGGPAYQIIPCVEPVCAD